MGALVQFDKKQIALIKRTVAKDADETEFDLFVEMCRTRGLNPLTRQVYCFIHNKNKPDRRQMTIVVSREGQRAIADRSGRYRPDERAPRFVMDKSAIDPKINPKGFVSAEVSIYVRAHGEWFPVTEIAYWEEYAPIKQIWQNDKPTGTYHLDPKKDNWAKMPRIMLAKCAEVAALRKAFPDDFGGLYAEEELDRGDIIDLTPSEMAEKAESEDRLAKIGGPDTYIIDWMDGGDLENVPGGKLADQVMAFVGTCDGQPSAIKAFRDRNRVSLQQFWGAHKTDALDLRDKLDDAEKRAEEVSHIETGEVS